MGERIGRRSMTRDETKELLMMLRATYPNFNVKPEEMTFTINAWQMMLEEYPYQAIQVALKIYVKTSTSGFAPSVSQLINAMYQPTKQNELSEGEAWALVKRAIQDGAYSATERYEELPDLVKQAVGSPNMIFQWSQTDSDEVNTVVMSNFQRTYRTILHRKEYNDRVPIGLSEIVNKIAEKTTPQIGVDDDKV